MTTLLRATRPLRAPKRWDWLLPSFSPFRWTRTRLRQPATPAFEPNPRPIALPPPSVVLSKDRTAQPPRKLVRKKRRAKGAVVLPEVPTTTRPFKLRSYQVDCISTILQELQKGQFTRLGVSAPTGSGKTAIFTALIPLLPTLHHPRLDEKGDQVLILVSSIMLAEQAFKSARRMYPHLDVALEQGSAKASGRADVTIATYQSIINRLDSYDPLRFKAVIVDEAHHALSSRYIEILKHFDPRITSARQKRRESDYDDSSSEFNSVAIAPRSLETSHQPEINLKPLETMITRLDKNGRPCVPILAFSATWTRSDGKALGAVFEKIVWHADWIEMIRADWLCPLRLTTIRVEKPLSPPPLVSAEDEVDATGEEVENDLIEHEHTEEITRVAVESWLEKAQGRRSTLVFAGNVKHISSVVAKFKEHGIDARGVHSGMSDLSKEVLFREFTKGEFPVLVNCRVLNEGADLPAIDCIIIARTCRYKGTLLQMIGRGLRHSHDTGKKDCLILDILSSVESTEIFGTPKLFGIDPAMKIENQSLEDLEAIKRGFAKRYQSREERLKNEATDRTIAYTNYDTVFDMVETFRGQPARYLSTFSELAWVGIGEHRFVLELGDGSFIKIERLEDSGTISFPVSITLANSSFLPMPIKAGRDFDEAIQRAERRMESSPGLQGVFKLRRNASWRNEPPSSGQKQYIFGSSLVQREVAGQRVVVRGSSRSGSGEEVYDEEGTTIDGVWLGKKLFRLRRSPEVKQPI